MICALCLYQLLPTGIPVVHAENFSWSGSIKTLYLHGEEAPANVFPEYRLSSNRVRLDGAWHPEEHWQINAALDYQYLWSDPPGSFNLSGKDYNRHLDLEKAYTHGDDRSSKLQIDRLNLQWRHGPLDITLGRQAIGFGRILIFSPLDVIAPFAPDAIDTDIRSGIDALHAVFNYGLDGQAGLVAVWGDEGRYNSMLGTWSDNRAGLDLLLLGGRLRGRNIAGAGVAGSLGTLGLKAEISFHRGRDLAQPTGDRDSTYSLGAVEAWYRFDNGISVVSQYLYNGPGSNHPDDYLAVLSSAPLQEGLTYLLGRHYLIVATAYELHPLLTLQGLAIYNPKDESALVRPMLDLNLADNLSLQVFWAWHFGVKPTLVNPLLPAVPRSEFGLRGNNGGLFLKWFF